MFGVVSARRPSPKRAIPPAQSPFRTMGIVSAGDGGSAGLFNFKNGLSSDPALAPYLQDLTPAQLQNALNGQAPSASDIGAFDFSILASCSNPAQYDPAICGPGGPSATSPSILPNLLPKLPEAPGWVWAVAAGLGVVVLIKALK